ncbi:MAG: TlpA family protein disulfide reductase [Planctomycetota bacterium]|nr:MAG: TlpA family protein disulfide reductase [Planctomycetota bacterium]
MNDRVRFFCCAAFVAACTQNLVGCSSEGAEYSEEECEELYEALSEDHQQAVREWGARIEAAKGTEQLEALGAQGRELTLHFLPRFQEVADRGCGLAKLEVLDLLGHIEPFEESQFDYAIGLLEDIVRENTDAWWISNLGDNDVVRYFLISSRRDRAIELLEGFIERTSDEEARRGVLFELGLGRLLNPNGAEDRRAALRMLDRVVEEWPESQDAEQARGRLLFERKLRVGEVMPPLRGHDVDGRETSLADHQGKVVVVDFFGFWCAPCVQGLPALKDLLAQYSREDLAVLGVDAHDDEETFRRGRKRHGVDWPCIFDGPEGPLSRSLGITSFPAVFLLDRDGVIRAKNPTEAEFEEAVRALIRGE